MDESRNAVEAAICLFEKSDSIEKAGKIGLNMLTDAKKQLNELFPGKDSTDLVVEVIDSFIEKML